MAKSPRKMPIHSRLLPCLMLLCLSLECGSTERPIELKSGVEGRLVLPGAGSSAQRAVVLLHGWNGSMDEVGGLFADLAEVLAERGIASLRFNFSGEGERVGYVVTSTFESRIAESRAAFERLRREIPGASYGVLGFSLGGLTAMELVGAEPDRIASLVLWSAAQDMLMPGDQAYADAARDAVSKGSASYPSYAEITLTRDFVLSYEGVNASRALGGYTGALLTVRGDKDYLPAYDRNWLRHAPGVDKRFVRIEGADHIFNVLDLPRPAYGERVIGLTADWFQRTLP